MKDIEMRSGALEKAAASVVKKRARSLIQVMLPHLPRKRSIRNMSNQNQNFMTMAQGGKTRSRQGSVRSWRRRTEENLKKRQQSVKKRNDKSLKNKHDWKNKGEKTRKNKGGVRNKGKEKPSRPRSQTQRPQCARTERRRKRRSRAKEGMKQWTWTTLCKKTSREQAGEEWLLVTLAFKRRMQQPIGINFRTGQEREAHH